MTEALARLAEIAPAPGESRRKDWGEVERRLGVELPADYKELIHLYGGSNWDDYLYVLEPGCPNENYDLIAWAAHQAEDLEGLWDTSGSRPNWRSRDPGSSRGRPRTTGNASTGSFGPALSRTDGPSW